MSSQVYRLTPFALALYDVTSGLTASLEFGVLDNLIREGFNVRALVGAGIYERSIDPSTGKPEYTCDGPHQSVVIFLELLRPKRSYTLEELTTPSQDPESGMSVHLDKGDVDAAVRANLLTPLPYSATIKYQDTQTGIIYDSVGEVVSGVAPQMGIDPSEYFAWYRILNTDPERIKKLYV